MSQIHIVKSDINFDFMRSQSNGALGKHIEWRLIQKYNARNVRQENALKVFSVKDRLNVLQKVNVECWWVHHLGVMYYSGVTCAFGRLKLLDFRLFLIVCAGYQQMEPNSWLSMKVIHRDSHGGSVSKSWGYMGVYYIELYITGTATIQRRIQ